VRAHATRAPVRREGDAVRLFTRRGFDWTGRYPAIASTATELRAESFTLDGEAVVCGPDGIAIFDALHSRDPRTAIPGRFARGRDPRRRGAPGGGTRKLPFAKQPRAK
jgi:hypothetical protein